MSSTVVVLVVVVVLSGLGVAVVMRKPSVYDSDIAKLTEFFIKMYICV